MRNSQHLTRCDGLTAIDFSAAWVQAVDKDVKQATAKLRTALSALEFSIVEDVQTAMAKSHIVSMLQDLRSQTSASAVEETKIAPEGAREAIEQMAQIIKSHTKDLIRENKAADEIARAKAKKRAEEEAAAEKTRKERDEEDARKQVIASRNRHVEFDWDEAGHEKILEVVGDEKLQEMISHPSHSSSQSRST